MLSCDASKYDRTIDTELLTIIATNYCKIKNIEFEPCTRIQRIRSHLSQLKLFLECIFGLSTVFEVKTGDYKGAILYSFIKVNFP